MVGSPAFAGCRSLCIDCCQEINNQGSTPGTSIDSQDTLVCQRSRGCAIDERENYLEKMNEAYDRMVSGKVRFRAVLITGN